MNYELGTYSAEVDYPEQFLVRAHSTDIGYLTLVIADHDHDTTIRLTLTRTQLANIRQLLNTAYQVIDS